MAANTSDDHGGARPPPSKAVLICQACGHDSHVDGDWTWRHDGDDVAIECPECGHELTVRPGSEAVARRGCSQSRC